MPHALGSGLSVSLVGGGQKVSSNPAPLGDRAEWRGKPGGHPEEAVESASLHGRPLEAFPAVRASVVPQGSSVQEEGQPQGLLRVGRRWAERSAVWPAASAVGV